jgi:DNA polymerase III delta subunit
MIAPLLYVWGDDELLAQRLVGRFASALEAELGSPLERWDLRADLTTSASDAAQLYERLATPAMFGAGTLAVVEKPGALVRRNDTRDRVVETIGLIARGHALAFIHEVTAQDRRRKDRVPGPQRLIKEILAAGGSIREAKSPRPSALATWIAGEAHDRSLHLAPGAAQALAERLGSRVTEGDVERRFLSRIASNELDKLALRHVLDEGPITADDVRALVAETTPASVWALGDAVGERRVADALAALDRLVEVPEPVLVSALHRRITEMVAMGDVRPRERRVPETARVVGVTHPFVAEKAAIQRRNWTDDELVQALAGLLELEAASKGTSGHQATEAQRRLGFVMWVRDHVGRSGRPVGPG